MINPKTGIIKKLNDSPKIINNDKNVIVESKEDGVTIVIKKDEKKEKEIHLESWGENGQYKSAKVPGISNIYNDAVFGGITWSKNHDKIIFIAEKEEVAAYTPYWKEDSEEEKTKEQKEKEVKLPHAYEKFLYNGKNSSQANNFGETLTNKKYPVIVVYNLKSHKFNVLDIQSFKNDGQLNSEGKLK